jgi:hypothetical protein
MSARTFFLTGLALAAAALPVAQAEAFCGFYVAKADAKLFNEASKVVMARDEDRTVITMVNDYKGDPTEFAVVIPVPRVLEREQIHVADSAIVDHLDAYTAPRLVEYFDDDPCRPRMVLENAASDVMGGGSTTPPIKAKALGVTIEARYTVGEYDILILSAEESSGLATWLSDNGYRLPEGAAPVLEHYLAEGMRFFVARVNLQERSKLGFSNLRPLQIAFESSAFMLPIRLGMINAAGPQELFVYTLTRNGRVEAANYRTVEMPSDLDVPIFVKEEFGAFYRALFERQVVKEGRRAVFLEYAWDMAWCDPCAAAPLSVAELIELGAFWLDGLPEVIGGESLARDAFVTRLHLRYDAEHFPHDLMFKQTLDRRNFQGRYILRHPWRGRPLCPAAKDYYQNLPARFEREAQSLAALTDWPIDEIRHKMAANGQTTRPPGSDPDPDQPWWRQLWPDD